MCFVAGIAFPGLTDDARSNRLATVPRFLSGVVILTLLSLQSQALAFHVHAMPDEVRDGNDHHRHGPAIHDHAHHGDVDPSPRLSESTAVDDVLTIAVPTAATRPVATLQAEPTEAVQVPELIQVGTTPAIEVRSHDPPADRQPPLRGPPSSIPE